MSVATAARLCVIEGCEKPIQARNTIGKCRAHRYKVILPSCAAEGCDKRLWAHNKSGFCKAHSRRVRKPLPTSAPLPKPKSAPIPVTAPKPVEIVGSAHFPSEFVDLPFAHERGDYRYVCYYGGRAGAKSTSIAKALVLACVRQPLRVLCTREYQNSIAESSKELLESSIAALGLGWFYTATQVAINGVNGTEIRFRGLSTQTEASIKSYEGFDIAWIEEAQDISESSWGLLEPTIRKPGSQIWVSFNPTRATDMVYRLFVAASEPPPRSKVAKVNYTDNPFVSDETLASVEYDRRHQPDIYRHRWLGELSPDIGTLRVLPMSQLERCVDAYRFKPTELPRPDVGLDIADVGDDLNAMATRQGACLTEMQSWHGSETLGDTARRADRHVLQSGAVSLYYDAGGIGAGVRSFLRELGRRPYFIRDVKFGEAVREPDAVFNVGQTNRQAFARRNAQLAWALKLRAQMSARLVEGEDIDPRACLLINPEIASTDFMNQMNQPTWDDGDGGAIKLRKASSSEKSPDMFDAACLAFAGDSERGLRL